MLSIVIPVHNRPLTTLEILKTLVGQMGDYSLKIIVVDSGNYTITQNSLLTENLERDVIYHLDAPANFYWCKSINLGIRYSIENFDNKFVLLLNDDLELAPDFVTKVFERLNATDDKSIISGAVYDKNSQNLIESGLYASFDGLRIERNVTNDTSALHKSHLLAGRCVIYPVSALQGPIQLRCRKLPHHYADLDLSHQASESGFQLFVDPNIKIYHKNQPSSETYSTNLFQRLFETKSPDRLLSWIFFWKSFAGNVSIFQIILKQLRKKYKSHGI
jgi:glycosyltransferase involved in cell wall biosynthesis